jgi:peptidoglycan biosynthesis protein MviN/MurJ (putative lipid II flippase)
MAALFNATMLLVLLRSHFDGLRERQLLSAMVRIGMASALMGATAFYTHEQLQEWLPSHAIAVQALRLGTAIGLAVVVLAASAWALRIREFNEGVAIVVRRFRRTAR